MDKMQKMLTQKVAWMMLIACIYLIGVYLQSSTLNEFIRSFDSVSIQNEANPSLLLGTPTTSSTTSIQSPHESLSSSSSSSSCNHSFSMKQILHSENAFSNSSADDHTPPCSHIFHPVDFFNNQSSPGYPFKDKFQYMWLKLQVVGTGTHRFSFESSADQSTIVNLDFVSVPKAATTTIGFVYKQMHNKSIVDDEGKVFNTNYQGMLSFYRGWEAMNLIQSNNSTAVSKSKLWTSMREPVGRFASAVGQEMNLRTATRTGKDFRQKCLSNDDPTATLQCAINHVRDIFNRDIKYPVQIHFIPSAVIYYKRMFSNNLPLEVIDFKDVNKVTKEFLMLDDALLEEVGDTKKNSKDLKQDALASLTVSALTEDMIKQICEIYAVDVLIMRHLNLSDKYCQHIEF